MKRNNSTVKDENIQTKVQQVEDTVLIKIKEVYNLMCKNNIVEINLPIEEIRVKIKRFTVDETVQKGNTVNPIPQLIYEKQVKEEQIKPEQLQIGVEEVVSPLNGVFYRSPSPGAPPFVKEGDVVQPGSVLCIIEAMKIMNEIKTNKKCRIVKVLCENGISVSVGTKLFLVEPL